LIEGYLGIFSSSLPHFRTIDTPDDPACILINNLLTVNRKGNQQHHEGEKKNLYPKACD